MLKTSLSVLIVAVLLACTSRKNVSHVTESSTSGRDTTSGQKQMSAFADKDTIAMPISGKAQNQKGGAVVVTKTETYWIDGLTSWDNQFADQLVYVWGEVITRDDNPVFLDTSKQVSQGIPVETEAQLKAQQGRYLIINARYELARVSKDSPR